MKACFLVLVDIFHLTFFEILVFVNVFRTLFASIQIFALMTNEDKLF